jgi:GNAT superfamily N-acetyltransferase
VPSASPALLGPRRIRLRDGQDRIVRSLGAGDAGLVAEMFRTLSPETVRARYGYLIHDMTPERAHRLVAPDPARESVIGIVERDADGRESLCAMGRLVLAPDGQSAECALLVHDRCRRLGMASRLLTALRLLGRQRRIPRLFAQVRRENRAMLGVFLGAGCRVHFDPGGEVVDVDIPLRRPKIMFDKARPAASFEAMASSEKKSFSPVTLVIDLALTAAFFTFIFGILKVHVQSTDPKMITLWSGLTAGCMSGVFWLAWQMLKTVFRFQRAGSK